MVVYLDRVFLLNLLLDYLLLLAAAQLSGRTLHRLRLLVAQQREGHRGSGVVLEPVGQELHVPGDVVPLPAREAGMSLMPHHFEAKAFVQALAWIVRAGHDAVHRFDSLCGA